LPEAASACFSWSEGSTTRTGEDVLAEASQALGIGVIVSAFLFGFRHGVDWDHIAAITDITSSQDERVDGARVRHHLCARARAGRLRDRHRCDQCSAPGCPRRGPGDGAHRRA
jgi:hypothetical protein